MKLTPRQIEFWRAFMAQQVGVDVGSLFTDKDIENLVADLQRRIDGDTRPAPQHKQQAPKRENAKRTALVSDVMKRLEVSDE